MQGLGSLRAWLRGAQMRSVAGHRRRCCDSFNDSGSSDDLADVDFDRVHVNQVDAAGF